MSLPDLLVRSVSDVVPRKLAEDKLASGKPMRIYLGIDPTGAKLHLGHAVPLRKLKAFQDAGHHVIFLVGSFTAMIGDPSGRDQMREPLTKEQVEKNFQTYKDQAGKILDFSKIELRYNHEWLEKLKFDDIVKLASYFTVNQMLEREMFKMRLSWKIECKNCSRIFATFLTEEEGKGMHFEATLNNKPEIIASQCPYCKTYNKPIKEKRIPPSAVHLHEFFYPLMVGYDSVVLDVDVELGGNDQLFNMLAGRTLQTALGKRDKFVLTTKLLEGTDGRKMSKTYDNCIWIDDSAKDMYGKILRVKDDLIVTYLELATELPMTEVKDLEKQLKKGVNPKEIKMRLAREVTALYHGAEAAAHAEQEFTNVFTKHELPEDMPEITVEKGISLVDLIAANKLAPSKSEARRLIEQGAVKLDDVVIKAIDTKAAPGVLKVGKRKFAKLKA